MQWTTYVLHLYLARAKAPYIDTFSVTVCLNLERQVLLTDTLLLNSIVLAKYDVVVYRKL